MKSITSVTSAKNSLFDSTTTSALLLATKKLLKRSNMSISNQAHVTCLFKMMTNGNIYSNQLLFELMVSVLRQVVSLVTSDLFFDEALNHYEVLQLGRVNDLAYFEDWFDSDLWKNDLVLVVEIVCDNAIYHNLDLRFDLLILCRFNWQAGSLFSFKPNKKIIFKNKQTKKKQPKTSTLIQSILANIIEQHENINSPALELLSIGQTLPLASIAFAVSLLKKLTIEKGVQYWSLGIRNLCYISMEQVSSEDKKILLSGIFKLSLKFTQFFFTFFFSPLIFKSKIQNKKLNCSIQRVFIDLIPAPWPDFNLEWCLQTLPMLG